MIQTRMVQIKNALRTRWTSRVLVLSMLVIAAGGGFIFSCSSSNGSRLRKTAINTANAVRETLRELGSIGEAERILNSNRVRRLPSEYVVKKRWPDGGEEGPVIEIVLIAASSGRNGYAVVVVHGIPGGEVATCSIGGDEKEGMREVGRWYIRIDR